MKEEEAAMRIYMHELKLAELAKANNKYAIAGVEEEEDSSVKERRRAELKAGGIAKQQLKKEREAMLEEDKVTGFS